MCCDNTLFGRVISSEEEAPKLREMGIEVIEYDDGEYSYNQPCPRLCERRCEIYRERPHTCETFACETIKSLRAAEITSEDVTERIRRTHAARENLARVLGGKKDMFDARTELTDAIAKTGRKTQLPHYASQVFALERLLDAWFREDSYKTMVDFDA